MRIILLLVAILVFPHLAYAETTVCEKKKNDILTVIEETKKCTSDSDCVIADYCICPFGSYGAFNINKKDSAITAMKKFSQECGSCMYECIAIEPTAKALCKQGRCEVAGQ